MRIQPTTPQHAMQLCEELAATGRLSDADSALLLATVKHYQFDHTALGNDWRKGQPRHYCSPECDAEAKREQNNQRVLRHREKKRAAAFDEDDLGYETPCGYKGDFPPFGGFKLRAGFELVPSPPPPPNTPLCPYNLPPPPHPEPTSRGCPSPRHPHPAQPNTAPHPNDHPAPSCAEPSGRRRPS